MDTLRKLGVKKIAVGLRKTAIVFDDGCSIQIDENLECTVHKGKELLFKGCTFDADRPQELVHTLDRATAIRDKISVALSRTLKEYPKPAA